MIDALVTGKLATAPQQRTTKTGKPFATARLRVPTTDPASALIGDPVVMQPRNTRTWPPVWSPASPRAGFDSLPSWRFQ